MLDGSGRTTKGGGGLVRNGQVLCDVDMMEPARPV